MSVNKIFFIVNPVSGSGNGAKALETICGELDARGIKYGYAVSEHRGHALELTQAALDVGEKRIIAVGGDGTVREVASVLKLSGVEMGIIPVGTGNDFAKGLKLPLDVLQALEIALEGDVVNVDAALANDAFFINVGGFGFDVNVAKYTENYKKRLNGMLPYLMGVMRSLIRLKAIDVTIHADDNEPFQESMLMLPVCNGTHFGGGMNIGPNANPSDGLLDVCIVKKIGRLKLLNILPKIIKGTHVGLKCVHYFKAKTIYIDAPEGFDLQLDGEIMPGTPVRFKVLEGAIAMVVGGNSE